MRLSKVLAAGACVLLLGCVALGACGSHQAGTTSSTVAKTSAVVSSREAAKRYFAAMAPAIALDYQGDRESSAAMAELHRKYGDNGPSQWAWWQDFASVLMRFEPREQELVKEYQAIQAPPAFRAAHAALVADNTANLALMDEVIHAINTQRPAQEWVPDMLKQIQRVPALDKRVVRQFRRAAAKVHVRVPAKLLKVYSD